MLKALKFLVKDSFVGIFKTPLILVSRASIYSLETKNRYLNPLTLSLLAKFCNEMPDSSTISPFDVRLSLFSFKISLLTLKESIMNFSSLSDFCIVFPVAGIEE